MGVGRRSLYGKKPFLKGLALLLFPGLILACIVPPLLARKKDKNTDKIRTALLPRLSRGKPSTP